MNKEKETWVIGHKNPDTDTICAAIAYANLKNMTESGAFIPKKAGELNNETKFVLDYFGVEVPETVESVGTQLKDLDIRESEGIDNHLSLKKAWERMRREDVVTLPIVNKSRRVEGVIVNGDIAYSYMDVLDNSILSQAKTQYSNIIETLNGKLYVGNEHAYFTKGKVAVASGSIETIHSEIDEDDLIISGNIKMRQLIALEQNPSCMVVCCASELDEEVIERARSIECVLISTEYDTFTTSRLINQSMPVKYFMTTENLIMFDLDDYVNDIKETVSKIRHRDFPVIDEQLNYVGMFSRRHLMGRGRKKIILVDHNEKSQAVEGIDEAKILEIIDHHRIGSLETISPIFFRNQPLGCTSTIVYQMYKEKNVDVSPTMAGIMLSAILSDTLMFRSPTCTSVDEHVARELARIADVDIEKLALSMFEAGSDFGEKSIDEILYTDFKTFISGDIKFGVSQVSAVADKQLNAIKEDMYKAMTDLALEKNLNMVFVMLTNILDEKTKLLFVGPSSKEFMEQCFGKDKVKDNYVDLPGVVSRKKQLIPRLMETFNF